MIETGTNTTISPSQVRMENKLAGYESCADAKNGS